MNFAYQDLYIFTAKYENSCYAGNQKKKTQKKNPIQKDHF